MHKPSYSGRWGQRISLLVLGGLLIFALIPIVMMLSMSFRDSLMIYADFWGIPWPIKGSNYSSALISLLAPTLRTLYICAASIAVILLIASLSAYAFARLSFVGKQLLFGMVVFMMAVPKVLQLTPNFIMADMLGLRNTYIGLQLFYIGGGVLFAIFLLRAFFAGLPEEMFEAARVEGATEVRCVMSIAVPLARPIMITIALMTFISIYNDLIWPMLMINGKTMQTLAMALNAFTPQSGSEGEQLSRPDLGILAAGYVFSSIPAFIVFMFGMKYFVQGLTSGAVKA
jgi:ABC-type glycerol-3-phosphate transport system permease component